MRPRVIPDEPRPLLFAHRGVSSEAPENTMAAFRLARDKGLGGVELDVHLTADGRLAVIHDHFTGRTAGAEGLEPGPGAKGRGLELERASWPELKRLDVGAWKGRGYSGEGIPLLEELFEELGEALYFDIELKNGVRSDYGLEAAVAKAIRGARGGRGLFGRCVVCSFNPVSLARFKSLMPEVPTGMLWSGDAELPAYLRHGEGRFIGRTDFLKPAKEKVKAASAFHWRRLGGYEVLPWTVDEPEAAKRLLALGCVGLVSNRPHELGVEVRR